MNKKPNRLILWPEMSLFIGQNSRAIHPHQHPTIQWVQSLDKAFQWRNEQGEWEAKKGLLIAPNELHECDAREQELLVLSIDPESSFGQFLQEEFIAKKNLAERQNPFKLEVEGKVLLRTLAEEDYSRLKQYLYRIFHFEDSPYFQSRREARIQRVISYIRSNIHRTITSQDLADQVHLSESRLLHLFKEEMGLPIRNYILWYRLQLALKAVLQGANLTQASYEAGFSDQAHLSRTCLKMVGVQASSITKHSRFIQVNILESV